MALLCAVGLHVLFHFIFETACEGVPPYLIDIEECEAERLRFLITLLWLVSL